MIMLEGGLLAELDPPNVTRGDLIFDDLGTIANRGDGLTAPMEGRRVALDGALVLPGFVCAHHHLYSALAPGMPVPVVHSFHDALTRIWWPMDRALSLELVEACALAGLARAALAGTTTVIDHHASPSAIDGSLVAIGKARAAIGSRAALAYEVTDRNGHAAALTGIEQAAQAPADTAEQVTLLGAHASFTLEDATLAAMADVGRRLHIHLAEDALDVEDARERGHRDPVARLALHGLLDDALLVHGAHADDAAVQQANEAGAWWIHNPTSNRNNQVGYARPGRFERAALGTDGIGGDMVTALREAFFAAREHRHDVDVLGLLVGGHRLASELFGIPFGPLQAGAAGDVVVFEPPPTPVDKDNLMGHLLFGELRVRHVVACGRFLVYDGQPVSWSPDDLRRRTVMSARALWDRYAKEVQ